MGYLEDGRGDPKEVVFDFMKNNDVVELNMRYRAEYRDAEGYTWRFQRALTYAEIVQLIQEEERYNDIIVILNGIVRKMKEYTRTGIANLQANRDAVSALCIYLNDISSAYGSQDSRVHKILQRYSQQLNRWLSFVNFSKHKSAYKLQKD